MILQEFDKELNEYKNILRNSKYGEVCRDYLRSREINEETSDYWNLGYCPYGYVPNIYKKLSDDNFYKFWEKMWGRLIIPIYDQNGQVISLSGRLVIKLNDRPKYDHYPFPSRKILFGLYQNKDNIRKEDRCIIAEGQIDVISSWQAGLKIVTSSFGAHCSLEHFALISRYTSNIDILYDEDKAGKKGTESINKFSTWGDLNVRLKSNVFPYGDDLDSWIRKHSPEELYKLIDKSKSDDLKLKLQLIKKLNS